LGRKATKPSEANPSSGKVEPASRTPAGLTLTHRLEQELLKVPELFRTGPASSQKRRLRKPPRCSTQRAGIAPPHAEGDGLSGVTRDGALSGVSSGPASFAGGVPLTRAMIPWAMPEAST